MNRVMAEIGGLESYHLVSNQLSATNNQPYAIPISLLHPCASRI
jgi:hypothetical protein